MKLKDKIRYSFIAILFFVSGLGVFCVPITARASEFDVYLKYENFTWKEYTLSGTQLLEESGPIYGIGLSTKSVNDSLTLKTKAELFGGSVDYDGQTQAGTSVKTDTDYYGYKIEGDLGWKLIKAKNSSLEPFAGLGYRWWMRDIQSTGSVIGYEEKWLSFYARFGIYGEHAFSDKIKVFAEGGARVPIANENEADFSALGLTTVTLKPGNQVSGFAEAGLKWSKFKVSVFYEGMRFSESDLDDVYHAFYQPNSSADTYGLNVGMSF